MNSLTSHKMDGYILIFLTFLICRSQNRKYIVKLIFSRKGEEAFHVPFCHISIAWNYMDIATNNFCIWPNVTLGRYNNINFL